MLPAASVSWCCIPPSAEGVAAAAIERIQAARHRCERWQKASGSPPSGIVLVFVGSLHADDVAQLLAIARERPGRVLVVLGPALGELPLTRAAALLNSGVGDIVPLKQGPQAEALVLGILTRWLAIDAVVDSPLIVEHAVGRSAAWVRLLRQVVEAARFSQAPVLVTGATGTGKELVARLIHTLDARREPRNLIVVDCTTLAPELSGSELFGHERGAFTGAVATREGAFALANGGTLFLDEIGDLPPGLQGQLLRAIQERTYKPVGGNTWARSDFRLVCATNRDLGEDVSAHRFRSDLYFRISGITCHTPSLRERIEDIPTLAQHFLAEALADVPAPILSGAVLEFVLARQYEGNVRDLRLLMHAMARHYMGTGSLTVGSIPEALRPRSGDVQVRWRDDMFTQAIRRAVMLGASLKDIGREAEDIAVRIVLSDTDSTGDAARRLGVSPRAVQARRRAARAS